MTINEELMVNNQILTPFNGKSMAIMGNSMLIIANLTYFIVICK